MNLEGKRFGRLTAIKFIEYRGDYLARWLFRCICGVKKVIYTSSVIRGKTTSCGCYQKERVRESCTVHGFTSHKKMDKFYRVWVNMRTRCENTTHHSYKWYGGKGIKVQWKTFEEFRYDMHESYRTHVNKFGEKQTTIDRIDTARDYCKMNCRWATWKEQSRNKIKETY